MKRNCSGFTLVELLVATSMVGILSIGLATLSVTALSATAGSKQTAEALNEMRTANSYMADNIRQGNYIYPSGSISLNGSECKVDNHCLAFTRPDAENGAIAKCLLIVYKFDSRANLGDDFKVTLSAADSTWADKNTWYLGEYQNRYDKDSDDTCVGNRPSTITGASQVILDYVARSDGYAGGPTYQLFTLHPSAPAAPAQVTLQLRQARQFGNKVIYIPASAAALEAHPNATSTEKSGEAGFLQTTVTLRNAS
jgi:prepilin-type N-terminal cleavage/methylation domain-containing protein